MVDFKEYTDMITDYFNSLSKFQMYGLGAMLLGLILLVVAIILW